MIGVGQRHAHGAFVIEGERALASRRDDFPTLSFEAVGDGGGGIAKAEDEHARHGVCLAAPARQGKIRKGDAGNRTAKL
jgi:hypothetical protein